MSVPTAARPIIQVTIICSQLYISCEPHTEKRTFVPPYICCEPGTRKDAFTL